MGVAAGSMDMVAGVYVPVLYNHDGRSVCKIDSRLCAICA